MSHPHINPELLLRIAGGDETAFAQLVEPIFDRLFGFAFSVTKSAELAEEVVQDAFLRIWQHRSQLPSIENIMGWIYTITRNLAFNTLKRQLKEPQFVSYLDAYFTLNPASVTDNLFFEDTLAVVHEAVARLPSQQAIVFKMSRIQGFTLEEIADQLKLSKETVKKHLTQALKTVRAYLQAHSGRISATILTLLSGY